MIFTRHKSYELNNEADFALMTLVTIVLSVCLSLSAVFVISYPARNFDCVLWYNRGILLAMYIFTLVFISSQMLHQKDKYLIFVILLWIMMAVSMVLLNKDH